MSLFVRNSMKIKFNLMIEPTNRCNLRCPTCFSHQDGRVKRDIPLNKFKKIIDTNINLIMNISLYNYGEPLLNKDIYQMIFYAKKKSVRFIKMTTNGMFLNRDAIKNLLKSGLDYLSISLDGATENVYSKFRIGGNFEKIISNIKNLVNMRNLLNNNLKIEIQFIIMRHNEHQIKLIEELSRKLKVDILRLKKLLVKKKKWYYLLPKSKKYNRYTYGMKYSSCFKPLKELVINCDGTVIPCCYIVAEDITKFNLGNIFQNSLREIIDSRKYKDFISKCTTEKSALSCCLNCEEGNLPLDYKIVKLND